MERRRGLPLGDVPGAIGAHEQERHPSRAFSLQRGQPVTDGLETHPETLREDLHVIAFLRRGRPEQLVGQDESTCEVLCESHARQCPCRWIQARLRVDHFVEQVSEREESDLHPHLEHAPSRRCRGWEAEYPPCPIVPSARRGVAG